MKILVTGSGGREHALAWKLSHNTQHEVFICPGNPGTMLETGCKNVDIAATDVVGIVDFCTKNSIDLVIPGPEASLVAGIAGALKEKGIYCFGPNVKAAQLESSKVFSKRFMEKYKINTARSLSTTNLDDAIEWLRSATAPYVIKADGLAAGKGVFICDDISEAITTTQNMLDGTLFGKAGHKVVLEQYIDGPEVSVTLMISNGHYVMLPTSRDHKKLLDYDLGPNTGGMGAFSPVTDIEPQTASAIREDLVPKILHGLREEDLDFCGFLYIGLIIDENDKLQPKVLEFNCRLGDPETQVLLPLISEDLAEYLYCMCKGEVPKPLQVSEESAIGIVLARKEYPEPFDTTELLPDTFKKTEIIQDQNSWSKVFHAGTSFDSTGKLTATGGRVATVVTVAKNHEIAKNNVYKQVKDVSWNNCQFRKDIG